ncbi:MAG TPA: hypothetical protein VK578_04995 [Edaphobacter sp.]|nr:hypothetical protein [Edaphobacter sp.]
MTSAEQAGETTCSACAIASNLVHVTSIHPFAVNPPNLLQRGFSDVGIADIGTMAIFQKAAANLSPVAIRASILGQTIDPAQKIGVFSDFLEALLAQQELG